MNIILHETDQDKRTDEALFKAMIACLLCLIMLLPLAIIKLIMILI